MTRRELNRATLARQLLLRRVDLPAVEAVERLSGLQAQQSTDPYVGLWSRLEGFRRDELTAAVEARAVVVATLHRVTLHLVSASDHRWLWPTLRPMLEQRTRRGTMAGRDHAALLREVERRAPIRMPDLRDLAPDAEPGHLTGFVQGNLPLVRVPPAGTWQVGGTPLQELAEAGDPDPRRLVADYLRAFGPATVRDAQAWSGLTRLAPLFAELELERIDTEDGPMFDVRDAPRPPADTAAPVRFLPQWDNVLLAHADRRRVIPEPRRPLDVIGKRTILVDGVVAGTWEWRDGDVLVDAWGELPPEAEAERLDLVRFLT